MFKLSLKLDKTFVCLEEIPLNIHVHNVEYIENRCERLIGTLYMTTFRLVFAPDQETENNNLVCNILNISKNSIGFFPDRYSLEINILVNMTFH